jgi:hypothetical protein
VSNFWQTVLPTVLAALVAGRVAVTRTGRVRKDIDMNLDLLGRLPADHPNRAMLEASNGDLLSLLIRRQRRYGPFTPAGVSFGAFLGVAAVALVFALGSTLLAAGVLPSTSASDPPTHEDQWYAAAFFLVMAVCSAVGAVKAARRQLREHPELALAEQGRLEPR